MRGVDPPAKAPSSSQARQPERSRLGTLARSVGRVVRWMFGAAPCPRSLPAGPKSGTARRAQRAAEAEPASAVANLKPMRARLTRRVEQLQQESARLHALLASGATLHRAQGNPAAPSLEQLLQRSRVVREQLQEARQELIRIERHIARERLLRARTEGLPTPRRRRRQPQPTPAPQRNADQARRAAHRRAAVAQVLQRAGSSAQPEQRVVSKLADGLLHEDAEVRRSAAQRLGEVGGPAAAQLLKVALQDPSERVCLAALNGLANSLPSGASDVFRRFLRHEHAALRLAALRGLGRADPKALALADALRALEDSDPAVRKTAATLLGWRRDDQAPSVALIGALGFALRDTDAQVRAAAADALGSLGDRRAVLSLIRAVGDEVPAVRQASLDALQASVGDAADGVGAGLEPAARAAALKRWWQTARVETPGPVGVKSVAARPAEASSTQPNPAAQEQPARAPMRDSSSAVPAGALVSAAALAESASHAPEPEPGPPMPPPEPGVADELFGSSKAPTAMSVPPAQGQPPRAPSPDGGAPAGAHSVEPAAAEGSDIPARPVAPESEPAVTPAQPDPTDEAGEAGFVDLLGTSEDQPSQPPAATARGNGSVAAEPADEPGQPPAPPDPTQGAQDEDFVDLVGQAEQAATEEASGVDHVTPTATPSSVPAPAPATETADSDAVGLLSDNEEEGFVDLFGTGDDAAPEGDEPSEGPDEEYESILDGSK